ncbi:MAG: hypothetical protein GX493_04640 [Firmicutes bacterium]|nr:hypothetical protein [Bacillota bacterium]
MKRLFILVCLFMMAAAPLMAKHKNKGGPKEGAVQPAQPVDVDFLAVTFNVDRAAVIRLSRYGLDTRELTLVLYLHAVVGRPLTEADLRFIAAERNWARLAWYYGLPPVVFEDGLLILRRPWRARVHPPLGRKEYRHRYKGLYEETLEIRPGRYEYTYRNKRLGVEERLEITHDKYEYKYKDRFIEERLRVDLRTYRYEYSYENRRTGEDVRRSGLGRPLTPELLYRQVYRERERTPGFRLTVKFNLALGGDWEKDEPSEEEHGDKDHGEQD